jgi:hypothetical protein
MLSGLTIALLQKAIRNTWKSSGRDQDGFLHVKIVIQNEICDDEKKTLRKDIINYIS